MKSSFWCLILCAGAAALLVTATPHGAWADNDGSSADASGMATEVVGDAGAGEKLYRRNCRACHGANGKGASSYPKLVGHPQAFLIEMVERYRAGEKIGPNTALMAQRVSKLDDDDIANVTAFIVSLEEN